MLRMLRCAWLFVRWDSAGAAYLWWQQRLLLPAPYFGEIRGVIEQVGDECRVKLLGRSCRSAVLALWFSTALRFKACDEQHTAFLAAA